MFEFKGFDDWVPIFRGGKQTDSMGREHDGDALIDRAIAAFDVKKHEPPAVIGHPAENAPAYGWVEGLKKQGDFLLARFKQVEPAFADMVKQGLFKKRSAAFYPDGSLRHVGFLGAVPPAVKGLPDMSFSEDAEAIFEFAEVLGWTWEQLADVFRHIREWLIEKEGQETADRIIPNWTIEDIRAAPKQVAAESEIQPSQYAEKEDNMTFKEKLIAFFNEVIGKMPDDGPASASAGRQFSEADIEALKKQAAEEAAKKEREKVSAEFAEKERTARQDARRAEISSWCEAMVKAGRMTPAMVKFGIPEFMAAFAEKEDAIEFGEKKEKATLYDRFKALFETELPKVVEFSEIATRDKDTGGQGQAGAKLETLIQAKMKDNKDLTYMAAFSEVQRENPELAREYHQEIGG